MELLVLEATNIGLNMGPLSEDLQIVWYSITIKDWWNAGIGVGAVMGILFMI